MLGYLEHKAKGRKAGSTTMARCISVEVNVEILESADVVYYAAGEVNMGRDGFSKP